MGFRGGVKLTPPQRILVFKYPSRDRVKGNVSKKNAKKVSKHSRNIFCQSIDKDKSAYPVKVLIESYEERSLILSGLAALTKLLVHQRKLRQEYTSTGLYLGQGNTFLIDRRKLFYE